VVGVTVGAEDPAARAARWAQVLGLGAPTVLGARQRLLLDGGWIDFEHADARGEGIVGYALAVADRERVLERARGLRLPVGNHGLTLFGTHLELTEL
jgi:hypothetical protein